ncbi:MAG: sugar-binding transcriptional regulator [Candidatus Promineifilaceae bacterium]|nr:sugar-binding transcriptional regulator [Candidatus Promineifilaceae bacterium]
MTKYRRGHDRDELLADVAEMYYIDNLTQAEVSRAFGLTRSAISRMLTEAREKGIVNISVNRPSSFDTGLEEALIEQFNLLDAHVLSLQQEPKYDILCRRLGQAAAQVLGQMLEPHTSCGVSWGANVSATIEVLQVPNPIPMRFVQLGGVLGPSSHAYNAQALVEMMARRVGGDGIYIYSPFLVEKAETAHSILGNPDVREAIEAGKQCDMALLGIGTITNENYSSLFLAGHISRDTIDELRTAGAVGDVSGRHFNVEGKATISPLNDRLICIALDDLLAIPIRFGVSGGHAKVESILGALRGGYVNQLVTDSITAEAVLALANEEVVNKKESYYA